MNEHIKPAQYIRCHDFAPDAAVVLLNYESTTPEGCVRGAFITFTKAELANMGGWCGLRAQMIVFLDPTLDQNTIDLELIPLLAGCCNMRKMVKGTAAIDEVTRLIQGDPQ